MKKSKFEIFIYDSKLDKTHLQGLKNLKKTIFNVLEANLDENLSFEKKNHKTYPQIQKFLIFLKFLKFVWWPEITDGWLKIGRKVRSELFCHQKTV